MLRDAQFRVHPGKRVPERFVLIKCYPKHVIAIKRVLSFILVEERLFEKLYKIISVLFFRSQIEHSIFYDTYCARARARTCVCTRAVYYRIISFSIFFLVKSHSNGQVTPRTSGKLLRTSEKVTLTGGGFNFSSFAVKFRRNIESFHVDARV